MSPQPRAVIAAMPGYAPPTEGRRGLRLDFNENTSGCSPAVLEALRTTSADDLSRYPEYNAAEAEITAAFGHSPESGLLTNGVDDGIQLAAVTYLEAGLEAVAMTPSFAMYRFYAQQSGAALREVAWESRPRADGVREFEFPAARVAAAITARTRVCFVASPNNPTGNLAGRDDLLRLAGQFPDCLFFVDEAYAEFAPPGSSLIEDVPRQPNLAVARTFSKAYGLAGARLGCLFAHPSLLPSLRKAHSPYNVNTLALRCGRAALRDAAWTQAYCQEVRDSRQLAEAALRRLGLPYWRSAANFVLFDAGGRAEPLLAGMRQRGILIRDRRHDVAGALRITCGTQAQTRRALETLEELL